MELGKATSVFGAVATAVGHATGLVDKGKHAFGSYPFSQKGQFSGGAESTNAPASTGKGDFGGLDAGGRSSYGNDGGNDGGADSGGAEAGAVGVSEGHEAGDSQDPGIGGNDGGGDGDDGGGPCFLTTAVVRQRGEPDDGPTLTTLRQFRDEWIMRQPGLRHFVEEYREIAPRIVAAIPPEHSSWRWIAGKVDQCVWLIEKGLKREAFHLYLGMVDSLKRKWL